MPVPGCPFFLQVTHISYNDDPREDSNLPGGRWHPPLHRDCFTIKDSTGWYILDPGRSPNSNDPRLGRLRRPSPAEASRLKMYRSATMFWEPYTHNYLHIPLDCTLTDVNDSAVFWKHPHFGVSQAPGRDDIAIIGHFEEHRQLHLPGPPSWFENLLPLTFQPPANQDTSIAQHFCTLAGDLAILIALIAFSTTPANIPRAIDCLFRPDPSTTAFNPHSGLPPDDRRRHKGLLVKIGYDPEFTNEGFLQAWERGYLGEIFS